MLGAWATDERGRNTGSRRQGRDTCLYVTEGALRDEGDCDGEEVAGPPSDAEFQAAGFIVAVDNRQTPLQHVAATVVPVLAVQVPDHRRSHSWPAGGGGRTANETFDILAHTHKHTQQRSPMWTQLGDSNRQFTHGTGMLMTTSLSSNPSSCSSYSMLTSQPSPVSEGQQFTADIERDDNLEETERPAWPALPWALRITNPSLILRVIHLEFTILGEISTGPVRKTHLRLAGLKSFQRL